MSPEELKAKLATLAEQSGRGRFFLVKHQPTRTKPVRVEFRQMLGGVTEIRPTLSELIHYADTVAEENSIYDAALKIHTTAGRVDLLAGVYAP